MRKPIPLEIPAALVSSARAYSSRPHDLDAVCYVLEDYPRLIAEIRKMRNRLDDIDREGTELDKLVDQLKAIARQIDDL